MRLLPKSLIHNTSTDDSNITATSMHNERLNPLLAQTPLSVNPFLDLPKPPTLPHNYASIPSTLPTSCLSSAPAPSDPELPAYVTSQSGASAHPSTIIKQNRALLAQLTQSKASAKEAVDKWEQTIRDRELQEKRRTAPGWLDSDSKLLEPTKAGAKAQDVVNVMDEPAPAAAVASKEVDDLGSAMDKAFGRSEMG